MYLHVGGDLVVPLQEVVAILDARRLHESDEPEFLRRARREGKLIVDDERDVSAYIVLRDRIFGTKTTTATLRRRIEQDVEAFTEGESEKQSDKTEIFR